MYRFAFLIILLLVGGESQGVFGMKITQIQKDEMVKCGFYTYLLEKGITNSNDIGNKVTDTDYNNFIDYLRTTYAPGETEGDGRNHLPVVFQDYYSFIDLLSTAYDAGGTACDTIRESKQGCNAFCGRMTCSDPFTYATCSAMTKELEGQKVCEPIQVKQCLAKNAVQNYRWRKMPSKDWFSDIDKNWFKVFFTTAGDDVQTGNSWGGLKGREVSALIGALFVLEFKDFLTGVSMSAESPSENRPWFSYVTRQLKNPNLKKNLWNATARRVKQY